MYTIAADYGISTAIYPKSPSPGKMWWIFSQGFYRAINIGNQVKEDVIVDIVRNMTEIAVEGWLSEDLLRRDVGILAGILTNCTGLI